MKLEIGQKLYLVYSDSRRGNSREVEVEKVGRKWAELSGYGGRVSIEDLSIDGGAGYSSPGRCYLSQEDYEGVLLLNKSWRDFTEDLKYRPAGITVDIILQARIVLGMEIK